MRGSRSQTSAKACGEQVRRLALGLHRQRLCPALATREKLLIEKKEKAEREEALEQERERVARIITERHVSRPGSSYSKVGGGGGGVEQQQEQEEEEVLVTCQDCQQRLRPRLMDEHRRSECPSRKMICPNYDQGCPEINIPYHQLNDHLRYHCIVLQNKEKMLIRCKQRLEKIQCATCGEWLAVKDWSKHEREDCVNHLVHCKNYPFGCQVMIPYQERSLHECIEESYCRQGLYFNGFGSYLKINESDILPPWSVELWLYRPSLAESMKQHLLSLFLQLPAYFLAYATEMNIKNKVMQLVRGLKEEGSSNGGQPPPPTATKFERQQWQKQRVEERMHLVNELTALIPVYSDAVLAYLQAFQAVAISMEAVSLLLPFSNWVKVL
eukprot:gene3053-3333_t